MKMKIHLTRIIFILLSIFLSPIALSNSAYQIELPKYRLNANELAVIVNDEDPLSVKIGEYYRVARNIPDENMLHVRFTVKRVLPDKEFTRILNIVKQNTPESIQAYAITWVEPVAVNCMSITSAFTFGYDKNYCSKTRCATTQVSPYYNSAVGKPYTQLNIRPTMSIAALNFADAKKLIDRGIASDYTSPPGTAYLVSTTDRHRNVRAVSFKKTTLAFKGWVDTELIETNALKNRDDVLFYFTGRSVVKGLETLNFVPGAIADHLTSNGGNLMTKSQMSSLRWLEAGATGSYGTVTEPCNHRGKFPLPGLVMERYTHGRTLLEAYWQSVQQPGEGIFIGEPLAAPYAGHSLKEEAAQLVLHTRALLPGNYRILNAESPIGPFQTHPAPLIVRTYQQRFNLPKLAGHYYRIEKIQ